MLLKEFPLKADSLKLLRATCTKELRRVFMNELNPYVHRDNVFVNVK